MADPMPPPGDFTYFTRALADLQAQVATLQNPAGTQRALTTRRQPVSERKLFRNTNFGLTAGGWLSYALVTLTAPPGKTLAVISATAGAAVLDTTSGGLTSSNARIVINGDVGGVFAASKDLGASQVNNVLMALHLYSFPVTPGDLIQVSLQLQPLNPAAFPAQAQNYASLMADATYTG